MPRTIKPKSPRQSPLKSSLAITFTTKKIAELNVDSNSFTITGRIMMKGEINPSYSSNTPMIRFIVADDSGAIQGVAFANVAETLYTQLEIGKVYNLSFQKATGGDKPTNNPVQPCVKKYMTNERNDVKEFQLYCNAYTRVSSEIPNTLDVLSIPHIQYQNLAAIKLLPKGAIANFTGLISRTWEVVVDPNGDPLRNTMDLSVKDDSMQLDAQVEMTIVGKTLAKLEQVQVGTPIRVTGAQIREVGDDNVAFIDAMGSLEILDASSTLSSWFKNLSENDKKKFETEFQD